MHARIMKLILYQSVRLRMPIRLQLSFVEFIPIVGLGTNFIFLICERREVLKDIFA